MDGQAGGRLRGMRGSAAAAATALPAILPTSPAT